MAHSQVKLFPKCRCVGLVGGRRNSVRYRTAVAPPGPYVTNARATALRRSCGNGVTGTGHPGKRLCRTVSGTVNAERATCGICLDSHLDGRRRSWCRCRRRSAVTGGKGIDERTAGVVVACRGRGHDVCSLAVGRESCARSDELVETEYPKRRIKNGWVFRWQGDAPEFMPVLGAGGENKAGVITCVVAAHDELGIKRINDRPSDVAGDGGVPTL